jgi:fused signal recognition particle receptor
MSEEKTNKPGFFRRLFGKGEAVPDTDGEQPISEASRPPEVAIAPEKFFVEAEAVSEEQPIKEVFEEPEEAPEPGIDEAAEERKRFLSLQLGLQKTRSKFRLGLDGVFGGKRQIDEQVLARLEETLVTADIGIKTAYKLLDGLSERVKRREVDDPEKVIGHLKAMIREMLLQVESPLRVGYGTEPFVVMVVGVNGSGKTTTIAKIAARHQDAGRKVILAAGDTFRAAAVDQLEIWGDRIGCTVVKGKDKADPSSVAFEALDRALKEDADLVLVDTAGRLHTRVPLVEELKKVRRTLAKKIPAAPHETLLVIDASMGQNAILQAKTFNEAVPITGIALTKLDGTARGGVIVGISDELRIPVRYIGIGEKRDDLRDFIATDFAEALFSNASDPSEREI